MAFSQNDHGYLLWDLIFYQRCGFWAINLEQEMLESQSKGSKYSDYSLVVSQKLALVVGAQGLMT